MKRTIFLVSLMSLALLPSVEVFTYNPDNALSSSCSTFQNHRLIFNLIDKGNIKRLSSALNYQNIDEKNDEQLTPLMYATKTGNTEAVKVLLKKGANIRIDTKNGKHALLLAIENGQADVLSILLPAYKNLSDKSDFFTLPHSNLTLLNYALQLKQEYIAEILWKAGIEINPIVNLRKDGLLNAILDSNYFSQEFKDYINKIDSDRLANVQAINHAIENEDSNTLSAILKKTNLYVNAKDDKELPPLINAAKQGNPEIIKILLSHGANINETDDQELSPLMHAAKQGNHEAIEVLLDHDANIWTRTINKEDALILAIKYGQVEAVSALLPAYREARMLDMSYMDLHTSFTYAFKCNQYSIAIMLWKAGAGINPKLNLHKDGVYEAVIQNSHISKEFKNDVIKADQEREANENAANIINLIKSNNINELKNFLDRNQTHIDAKDDNGFTPLTYASMKGNTEAINILLSHGAKVNITTKLGDSALLFAIRYNHNDAFKMLLDAHKELGSESLNTQNDIGQSPLTCALKYGRLFLAYDLINAGADVNYNGQETYYPNIYKLPIESNLYKISPLAIAQENKLTTIEQFLIEKGAKQVKTLIKKNNS